MWSNIKNISSRLKEVIIEEVDETGQEVERDNEDILRALKSENDYYNNVNNEEIQIENTIEDVETDGSVESYYSKGMEENNKDTASTERISPAFLKPGNEQFKYESFLRLRNMLYLCLLLKKNPSIHVYRHHYLEEIKRRDRAANRSKVETSGDFFTERYDKLMKKLNFKMWRDKKTSNNDTATTDTKEEIDNASYSRKNVNSASRDYNRPRIRKSSI